MAGNSIRRLLMPEMEALYKERILADFPPSERRPLSSIRKMYRKNRYTCLVLEEAGHIVAYATFNYGDAVRSVLLDYFAVDQAQRGSGIGSRFLSMLTAYWPDKDGILIECESPDTAKTEPERQTRTRRIEFYERGGAQMTPLRWRAFGVVYCVLWLPIRVAFEETNPGSDLLRLYGASLPPLAASLFLKLE